MYRACQPTMNKKKETQSHPINVLPWQQAETTVAKNERGEIIWNIDAGMRQKLRMRTRLHVASFLWCSFWKYKRTHTHTQYTPFMVKPLPLQHTHTHHRDRTYIFPTTWRASYQHSAEKKNNETKSWTYNDIPLKIPCHQRHREGKSAIYGCLHVTWVLMGWTYRAGCP